ncbi:MAG TPA: hypothetical protein VF190_09150, partial [Rhodothermales bacterium]
ESDQIGLTGFDVFDVHRYELINDEEDFRVFSRALPPLDDIVLEGGRNLGMFFASGPFPLRAGQTERFSMALIFAEKDFNDPSAIENSALARKKETVQQIYNADYRFARPPNKPTVEAIAGDGMVTLIWDDLAERSFDPFLREFDFEGYLIYRSTEPNFEENLVVTDAFGNKTFQKPIAQFDLQNGINGLHPVDVNGVRFNLGTETGLRHTYIDRDVRNGETYYYAVVAYDRGLIARDAFGNIQTGPDGSVRGIAPSLTTAVVKNDVAGNIVTDVNTAVATPRAPAAGYVPPDVGSFERSTLGTGLIDLQIVVPGLVQEQAEYELRFTNPSIWQDSSDAAYTLTNLTTGTVVEEGVITGGRREISPIEGFILEMQTPMDVVVIDSTVRMEGDAGTFDPLVRPASTNNVIGTQRGVALPADFAIHFTESIADTSLRLTFGTQEIPVPFYVENLTTGERADFMVLEDIDSLRNGAYDHGETIALVMGETPDTEPEFTGGRWRGSWVIRLIPPDPDIEPGVPVIPPAPGTVLRFRTEKPFQTGDVVRFTLQPEAHDSRLAKTELDSIFVVPNPYVASSTFEPPNTYRAGRGERRIVFMNLPPVCTIRIYTISGQLVQTLRHDAPFDDGQEMWDLVTKDGMNAAYGVYIYHVESDFGDFIGRFAIIK